MKLLRVGEIGKEIPAALDAENKLRDLSGIVADIAGETLSSHSLSRLKALNLSTLPLISEGIRIGACVGGVRNFIAVGLNYADRAAESKMAVPVDPVLFNKAPSCIVGPNDDVLIPPGSLKTDWEVELAVVIGERSSYVSESHALDYIAGYYVCNDVSERAYRIEGTGQWTKGKGCPTFGPLGPWLVTRDEIADVQKLKLWLDLNGQRLQNDNTSTMVFGVAHLVAYISRFMVLEPGDVATGDTDAQTLSYYNGFLVNLTNPFVDGTLIPLFGKNAQMEISEFKISALRGGLYAAVFIAEYTMRLSSNPHITQMGMHTLVGRETERDADILPTNDHKQEAFDAYRAGKVADTLHEDYGYFYTPDGLALQIINGVINSSDGLWPTAVKGGATVKTAPIGKIGSDGETLALYAQRYASGDKTHLLITNKSAEPQAIAIAENGKTVKALFSRVSMGGTDLMAQNTADAPDEINDLVHTDTRHL